jgi:serine/threonine protein kinase
MGNVGSMIEFEIASRLLVSPQPNVVKIYKVVKTERHCFIDMEKLDDTYVPYKTYLEDFKKGLNQLHGLGVAYIDIKSDNIGYSSIDKCYKIFDFDCSGLVDMKNECKWERRPFEGLMYENICKVEESLVSLYELDNVALKKAYKLDD